MYARPSLSSSSLDSVDALDERPPPRRSSSAAQPKRVREKSDHLSSSDNDSNSADDVDDEEKRVDSPEERRKDHLRRAWRMASLPSGSSKPDAPGRAASDATKKSPWRSPMRLIYLGITGTIVIVIIVLGSILMARSYKDTSNQLATIASSTPTLNATAVTDSNSLPFSDALKQFPELQYLLQGNQRFRNDSETDSKRAALKSTLAGAQHPKFLYLGCSDSRMPESSVFDSLPGELFVTRNVGNQFIVDDLSAETVTSYAVAHLNVQHIIVMGHYGCGAVATAMSKSADKEDSWSDIGTARIDAWIRPIERLYATSNRSEIVEFRQKYANASSVAAPDRNEPAFRALVEENVKQNVLNFADDPSVLKSWKAFKSHTTTETKDDGITEPVKRAAVPSATAPIELWIHGWVFDIATYLVTDLGVSIGPS